MVVHSGARLGSDGFGYVHAGGAHRKIPHVGGCVIEDDVEIGANTTVDRGSIGDTRIGAGSKLDNFVHLGHNVQVGRGCLILAQVGISGSTVIEDGVIVGGQAGIGGHLRIGRGARIGAQAGVMGSVPAGETWSGYPARPPRGGDAGIGRAVPARRARATVGTFACRPRTGTRRTAGRGRGAELMVTSSTREGAALGRRAVAPQLADMVPRRTIAGAVMLHGVGLHLGRPCTPDLSPGRARLGGPLPPYRSS